MKKKHHHMLFYWLPLVTYCVFIYIMSVTSTPDVMPDVAYSDKMAHCGAFAIVAVLFWRALGTLRDNFKKQVLTGLTFLASMAYGLFIEASQFFISYRSAEFLDMGADALGTIMGILFCFWYYGKKATPPFAP